jgi:hypothetical protein
MTKTRDVPENLEVRGTSRKRAYKFCEDIG